jgi:6-phosphogluconolactonase
MSSRVERIRTNGEKLPGMAAEIIASELVSAVSERGAATLCLSGGSTPQRTYELLTRFSSVPWNKIEIFFGDERCVPPEHEDSNYRMARAALFEPARIADTAVHRLRGEATDFEAAASEYEALLPPAFDVLVLGIGEDGHTASLFPHSPALHDARRVMHVVGNKPPPNRLTLTPRALANARLVLMLAAGQGKAAAVHRALEAELDIDACPAQIAREGVWLMDAEAAAALSGRWNAGRS